MNPLALFTASTILAFSLLVTLSPWAALWVLCVDIAVLVSAFIVKRVHLGRIMKTYLPLLFMGALAAVSTLLYGRPSGEIYVEWGLVCVSQGSLYLALAIGLRILAIGLPAVGLVMFVDPTFLADAMTQLWHAPRRFVMATLASFRLLGLFVDDWQSLEMARRARGLGSGRGPIAAVMRLASQAFALLVLAMRRASSLALAMDARGINLTMPPTRARTAHWRIRDWMFMAASICVAAIAIFIAIVEHSSGGVSA